MPVYHTDIISEHRAVRSSVGIFDVSHMGEIIVEGVEAKKALNFLTCNDLSKIVNGKAQYTAITNYKGGVVDDIIIYQLKEDKFLLCVNAANTEKDFNWLCKENKFNCTITNVSEQYAQIAVQGPKGVASAEELLSCDLSYLPPFHFLELKEKNIIAARTGYTGEDGVELFLPSQDASLYWERLCKIIEKYNGLPCGLGARDTLRLEVCYPLHGHELSDDITAIESGLGWVVKPEKGDFIGREVLKREKEQGAKRKIAAFVVTGKGIARHGDKVYSLDKEEIGYVTSGTKTPTVNKAIGLALVSKDVGIGDEIFVEIRGKLIGAQVVKKPFYRRKKNESD
ncbi:MAG: glycine cleavage system aminomethyltransferase GcvT [Candidatus Dadabacteria bacterium]|nr:MAG: glycine cleavage system aminomethyltransferase GcvT [Candidatus Dadabacteria bacterium]